MKKATDKAYISKKKMESYKNMRDKMMEKE